jgi:hypothetical protein
MRFSENFAANSYPPADLGHPDRIRYMMPLLGTPNFPISRLVWDILVLTAYLVVNVFIVTYLIYTRYRGRSNNRALILPIVLLSIPLAISIHTVTAFLFVGLKTRSSRFPSSASGSRCWQRRVCWPSPGSTSRRVWACCCPG